MLGLIGSDQESDILKDYVKDYEFTDEFEAITKYVPILRNDEKCDLVIQTVNFLNIYTAVEISWCPHML